ncbi:MAG TPA: glycine betaine ABC transporter substrate-binding protein, partial [Minicystis sp.]|nr:glycine betaine ABC transporter substrate-binding protein [Minicystis sp.]
MVGLVKPAALAAVGGVLLAASSTAAAPARVAVGSKRFTESYILGEIVAELARRGGDARVEHEQGLGGTAVVFRALEEGSIDVYPEYTGTIVEAILHGQAKGLADIRAALAGEGIAVSDPLGFENTYALAASAAAAARTHVATISDLARHPELRIGVSHEFL